MALPASLGLALAACDDGGAVEGDAGRDLAVEGDAYVCFSGGLPQGASEGGTVEIGTGDDVYSALQDEQVLPLILGGQCAYHFDIWPRIQGLNRGDLEVNAGPENPSTLMSVYDEEGVRLDSTSCGFRVHYPEEVDGFYDLGHARLLRLSRTVGQRLDGERVRIVVEVLDPDGRYARDDVWIVAETTGEVDRCESRDAGAGPDAGVVADAGES